MRQSQLFTKTRREAPKDEVSKNAQLLIRAGYLHKEMAGVYNFLPLGLRVFNKIADIIREEMNAVGGQELFMSTLQGKDVWEPTERWDSESVSNIWFKTELASGTELGLAFTHEEPITRIMANYVSSYKDLPLYAYHIQNKFRNEVRAKSGILRGREFFMKDLYSFSRTQEEHEAFYEQMKDAYMNVFKRVGIGAQTYTTVSSGGSFSKYSYEFQTVCAAGEDTIFIDENKNLAINSDDFNEETLKDFGFETDKSKLREEKSIEVGDIYSLGTRFSEALGLRFKNENGVEQPVVMGSYGIGVGRLLGTVVEVFADEKGIVWPESVAPFTYHLVELSQGDENIKTMAEGLYEAMTERGIHVLYDDRDTSAGEKLNDSDLLGIPYRVVVGKKTTPDAFEVVRRRGGETLSMSREELLA
ncbi:MAG: aminoacyl--tRNA ligase-related protein [Candidatus Paceibacteria bacterium]